MAWQCLKYLLNRNKPQSSERLQLAFTLVSGVVFALGPCESIYETAVFRSSGLVGFSTSIVDGIDLFTFWCTRHTWRQPIASDIWVAIRFLCFWCLQNAGLGDSRIRPQLLALQLYPYWKLSNSTLETRQMSLYARDSCNRRVATTLISTEALRE